MRSLLNSSEECSPGDVPTQRSHQVREVEKLELHEGRLIARDITTNVTRPLTDEEIRRRVEIVSCKDKQCSAELQGREMDASDLLLPAIAPPSLPSVNDNAVPTFLPTQSIRTVARPLKRTNVLPDAPVMTN